MTDGADTQLPFERTAEAKSGRPASEQSACLRKSTKMMINVKGGRVGETAKAAKTRLAKLRSSTAAAVGC